MPSTNGPQTTLSLWTLQTQQINGANREEPTPKGMQASLVSVLRCEGNSLQQILGLCDSGHLGVISMLNQDTVLCPGQSEPWWYLWKPHKACLPCFSFTTRIMDTHLDDLGRAGSRSELHKTTHLPTLTCSTLPAPFLAGLFKEFM